jgi:lipoprotein-anchoring transpeptidase ErfK/SrfK
MATNKNITIELIVDIHSQTLTVEKKGQAIKTYYVATSKFGVGQENGSFKTPLGWHEIKEKIGDQAPINTVFIGRIPTGEIYSHELGAKFPERDWILTRILWLSGLEPGKNQGANVDTFERYIYIHGVPDEIPMGKPSSHGCVRMHNNELLELFGLVNVNTKVLIT